MLDGYINLYCQLKHQLHGRQLNRQRQGDATQAELMTQYRQVRNSLKQFLRETLDEGSDEERELYSEYARELILKNLHN